MKKLPSLLEVIKHYGLDAKKSLGQNFIINSDITDRIATAADILGKNVIEVGPGPGGLTRSLLDCGAKSVLVIEKDQRCLGALQDLQSFYGPERLIIIEADALKISLCDLSAQYGVAQYNIVSNLPYNIATKLVLNWTNERKNIQSMSLMFQKEVADRITASVNTNSYGSLSIWLQWQWNAKRIMVLAPGSFSPPPKVHSAIVHFKPLIDTLYEANEDILQLLLSVCFNQRRKMLRRSLQSLPAFNEELFIHTNISPEARPEQLTVEDFCNLARQYENITSKNKLL